MISVGDSVLVIKPKDSAEHPVWVNSMDTYGGNTYKVADIWEDDCGDQFASLSDAGDVIPFTFALHWLLKDYCLEDCSPWEPGKMVICGSPKQPETVEAFGLVGMTDSIIKKIMEE